MVTRLRTGFDSRDRRRTALILVSFAFVVVAAAGALVATDIAVGDKEQLESDGWHGLEQNSLEPESGDDLFASVDEGIQTGSPSPNDSGENESNAIVATSVDEDATSQEDSVEVAVTVSPPGPSFESDATVDIWAGAFISGGIDSGVEGEDLTVTVENPDGGESTFDVTTDGNGSAGVTYDLSDGDDGEYVVTVEHDEETTATLQFQAGPVPHIVNDGQSVVDEEITIATLVREGESPVTGEDVEMEIRDENWATIVEETVTTDSDGFAEITFTPTESEGYRVDAELADGPGSDLWSFDVGEYLLRTDRSLVRGIVSETTVFGGYLRSTDGQAANTELEVEFVETVFGDEDDVIHVSETVTTDENGFFAFEYELPEDAADEFSLDIRVETTDGEEVLLSGDDRIRVDEIEDEDDGPDPDPDPVTVDISADERTVSPDEPFELDIEATDDGEPIVDEEVDVHVSWEFSGPPLRSTTVTTDSDGAATVTVTPSDDITHLDGVDIRGHALLEYDDEVYTSAVSLDMERYDIWFSTNRVTPGEETTVSVEATEVATGDPASGVSLQFAGTLDNHLSDVYASGSMVTGADGEDEVTFSVPETVGPSESFAYFDRYTGEFSPSTRATRLDHGTLTVDAEEESNVGRPLVQPGEQVPVELDADAAETASGIVFDNTFGPTGTLGTNLTAADGGTLQIPTWVEDGDSLLLEMWATDENGEFYHDTVWVDVEQPDIDEGTLTGTVTEADTDDPIEGASVVVGDEEFIAGSTTTDADGEYELDVEVGIWDVVVDADGYEETVVEDVTIEEDETTTQNVELNSLEGQPGTVEGEVTDTETDGSIAGAQVSLVDDDWNTVETTLTDDGGAYELSADAGTYTLVVTAIGYNTQLVPDVELTDGQTTTEDVELEEPETLPATVEHVDGTEPAMEDISVHVTVDDQVRLALVNETAPESLEYWDARGDLGGLGADESTVFEIEVTIDDIEPRMLVGAGEFGVVSIEDNGDGTANMTIEVSPIDQQLLLDCDEYAFGCGPTLEEWAEGDDDQATTERDAAVIFSADPLPEIDENHHSLFEGTWIQTDAQQFGTPSYDPENESFTLEVAGPAETVDGESTDGQYDALLGASLLTDWEVDPDNPEDGLVPTFDDEPLDFETHDHSQGLVLSTDLGYSAGELTITPDTDEPYFDLEVDEDASTLEVIEGENVTVFAEVENIGDAAGSGEAFLGVVEGDQSHQVDVDLEPGENTTVMLEVPVEAGDNQVLVATLDEDEEMQESEFLSISVEEDAPFLAVDIDEDASTLEVMAGENATAVAEIENTGTQQVTGEAVASIGSGENSTEIDLEPDESTTVELGVPTLEGDEEITVSTFDADGQFYDSDSADLTVDAPPFFGVEIDEDESDLLVKEDEPITVVATIENNGTLDDTQEIALTDFDGEEVATTELELGSGENETVELTWDTDGVEPSGGTVNVTSTNETATVGAHILDTEDLDWRFDVDQIVDSSPTIVDDTVYVGSHDEKLHALDLETGEELWNVTTGDVVRSSPQVVNDTVYVGSYDGFVYALDTEDGSEEWTFETGDSVLSSPTVNEDLVYVGSHDGYVYAIETETGEKAWEFEAGDEVNSSPTIAGDTVYIGDREEISFLNEGRVYALNAETGDLDWKEEFNNWVFSSPTVADGTVYVGSDDTTLYAFDAQDGSIEWEFDEPDEFVTGTPTVVDGTVFVGDHNDTFFAIDADTGEKEWRFDEPTDYLHSSATVVDDVVYFGSIDGTVYGLDVDTGDEVWSYETGAGVWSSPTVVDGSLVVGSDDGGVYALDVSDDGTSEDSRIAQGTLGHTDLWHDVADQPALQGTVTASTTGEPIAGVEVTVSVDSEYVASTTTDEDGEYAVTIEAGTYNLTFDHSAFTRTTVEGVEVDTEEPTVEDVALDPEADGFTVESIELDEDVVVEGDDVSVTATILNNEPETIEQTVTFETESGAGTELRDEKEIELEPGEEQTVTLQWDTESGDSDEYDARVTTDNDEASVGLVVIEPGEGYYDVTVTDTEVAAVGNTLNVTAAVENRGDGSDVQDVRLFVVGDETTAEAAAAMAETEDLSTFEDDDLREVAVYEDLELDEGAQTSVDLGWNTTHPDLGDQVIVVATDDADAEADATVVSTVEPVFEVSIDRLDAAIRPGQELTVEAAIENIGATGATQEIALVDADSEVLDETEVTLDGADNGTAEFVWETDQTDEGLHDLTVESANDSTSATVSVLPGTVVYDDVSVSETNTTLGSSITVTATVTNAEDDVSTAFEAPVSVDTGVVDTVEDELEPGEEATLTFAITMDEPGETEVTVGDADPKTVTVEKAWSQYGLGDTNVGHNDALTGPTAAAVEKRWDESIGEPVGEPIVVNDTVYVGTEAGAVYAVDARSGETEWDEDVGADVTGTPAVVNDTVFVPTDDGIVALDTEGNIDWDKSPGSVAGLAVANDTVFAALADGDGAVYAFDGLTGDEHWSVDIGGDATGAPAVVGDVLYVGLDGADTLVALNASETATDRDWWSVDLDGDAAGAPVYHDETLFVGTTGEDAALYALDAEGDGALWHEDMPDDVVGSPAVADDIVYVGTDDGQVQAFETRDGSVFWDFHTGSLGLEGSLTVADGMVSVGIEDVVEDAETGETEDRPQLLGIDAATGQQQWHHDLDANLTTGPTIINGAAFVGHENGELLALQDQTDGPILDVEHVTISDPVVEKDEPFDINVTVTNTGTESDVFEIEVDCHLEGVLYDCGVWVEEIEPGERKTFRNADATLSQRGFFFVIVDGDRSGEPGTVTPPGTINGTVTDSQTDEELEGIEVTTQTLLGEIGGRTVNETVTDEDGFYQEKNLSSRSYLFTFDDPNDKYIQKEIPVWIPPGETITRDVELDEFVWLTGELERPDGEPAANHTISADEEIPMKLDIVDRNRTAEDGSFKVGVPANDTYALVATEQSYPPRDIRYFPENDVADLYAHTSVNLTDADPGDVVDVGTVRFPEGHNVNVTVIDAEGEPVVGANVTWRDINEHEDTFAEFHWIGTDFDGKPGGTFDDPGVELPAGPAEVIIETPWGERIVKELDIREDTDLTPEPDPEYGDSMDFEVTEIVAPTVVPAGETVTANATIQNVGTVSGTQNVTLGVQGHEAEVEEKLSLQTGENATIEFEWNTEVDDVGEYGITASTDNDTATVPLDLIVMDEPYFNVRFGTAGFVEEGDTLNLTAGIENLGEVGGVQDINMSIDGEEVDVEPKVSLGPKDQTRVRFSWETEVGDAGIYNVTVASEDTELTDEIEVAGPPEPFFRVEIDDIDEQVDIGEVMTVEANVVNVGRDSGTQTIALTDEHGTTLDETEVTLDAGRVREPTDVTFTWVPEAADAGERELTVESEDDNVTRTVTVGGEATPIAECTVIDESGVYVLEEDLEADQEGGTVCVEIIADDVFFDGQGHSISGGEEISSDDRNYGIRISDSDGVTVEDVRTDDWTELGVGVYAENSTDVTLSDVTALVNTFGIRTSRVDGVTIGDSTAFENTRAGVQVADSQSVTVDDVDTAWNTSPNIDDEWAAVYIRGDTTDDVILRNVTAESSSSGHGIRVDEGPSDVTIENALSQNNAGTGVLIESDDVTVHNTTATDNQWDVETDAGVTTTVENLNIGQSVAPNTTLSFEAENAAVRGVTSPPENPIAESLERYFEAETVEDATETTLDVSISYDEKVLGDVDEETVLLWQYDDEWEALPRSSVDTEANTVEAELTDLSMFGIFGGDLPDPVEIEDWYDLDEVRNDTGNMYVLANDLNETTPGYDEIASEDANDGLGFEPLGELSGTFDGAGNEIHGLTINRTVADDNMDVGLFSIVTTGGTVTDLHLEDVDIAGYEWVGAVAGANWGGTLTDVSVTGDIVASNGQVGGVAGEQAEGLDSVIHGATVNVSVTGDFDVGGIVGDHSVGVVRESNASGTVSADWGAAGGIAGSSFGDVERSFADVTVTSTGAAGGITGAASGNLTDTYSQGTVSGDEQAGGITGINNGDGNVSTSYVAGEVTGGNITGAIVGENADVGFDGDVEYGTVTDVYWDESVTGQDDAVGNGTDGLDGDVSALSTDQMTGAAAAENMSALDFEDAWNVTTEPDDYPELRFEDEPLPLIDVNANGNPAMDTTGDGLLNDVRGDGEFTVADVQALFAHRDSGELEGYEEYFNFAGTDEDEITIFDIQALFQMLE